MKRMKLKDNHPHVAMAREAFAELERHGVSVEFCGNSTIIKIGSVSYMLEDETREGVTTVPPMFEYKLVIEKEED